MKKGSDVMEPNIKLLMDLAMAQSRDAAAAVTSSAMSRSQQAKCPQKEQ
jgi:hypothetical protein